MTDQEEQGFPNKGFLQALIDICQSLNTNQLGDQTVSRKDLQDWVKAQSQTILSAVIPSSFWSDYDMEKPQTISEVCPGGQLDSSVAVLLVVLWSSCSVDMCKKITGCLNKGLKEWRFNDSMKSSAWLQAYVSCIMTSTWYSRKQMSKKLKKDGQSSITDVTCKPISKKLKKDGQSSITDGTLLDAYAIKPALSNTSEWFGVLTSINGPTLAVKKFYDHLKREKPAASFIGSLSDLKAFSDNREIIQNVSVMTWFTDNIIKKKLTQMFELEKMKELVLAVRKTRNKNTPLGDKAKRRLDKISRKVVKKLGVELSPENDYVGTQLVAITVVGLGLVEMQENDEGALLSKEVAMRKFSGPLIRGGTQMPTDDLASLLRDMIVQSDPPLFPLNNAIDFVEHWRFSSRGIAAEVQRGEGAQNQACTAANPKRKKRPLAEARKVKEGKEEQNDTSPARNTRGASAKKHCA